MPIDAYPFPTSPSPSPLPPSTSTSTGNSEPPSSSSQPPRTPSPPSQPPLPPGAGTGSRGPWGQRTPQCTPRRRPTDRSAVTPSPTRMVRAESNESEWHPPEPLAVPGSVADKMGRGRVSSRDADAEQALSSYEKAKFQKRATWGSSLLESVVNATVLSAAIGLTAYRIWTEGWGSIVSKHDEAGRETQPVDAYEDTVSRSEPASPQVPTTPRRSHRHYAPSSPSTRRRPPSSAGSARRRRRPQRQTIAELLASQAESSTPRRSYTPDSDLTSTSSLTGITGMTDGPYSPSALDTITASDMSEESGDETNTRLAAMAHRVQGLIAEGRAALTTPVSTPRARPVSGTISPSPIQSPAPIDIPRREPRGRRVSGWDTGTDTETDATESDERARPTSSASVTSRYSQALSSSAIGIGHPPGRSGTTSRPVSVSSLPRSASSSSSSRYQPAIPPLPWRRESIGATGRWVQKQHSPAGSLSGRPQPPQPNAADAEARSPPVQHEMSRASPRVHDAGSRIPRPGHSRASSSTGADSPSVLRADGRERDREGRGIRVASSASNASSTGERGGWNSPVPVPTQGLVAARTSLFSTVAERNANNVNGSINRSKIPIRRSIGSISSVSAVQTPSPKA